MCLIHSLLVSAGLNRFTGRRAHVARESTRSPKAGRPALCARPANPVRRRLEHSRRCPSPQSGRAPRGACAACCFEHCQCNHSLSAPSLGRVSGSAMPCGGGRDEHRADCRPVETSCWTVLPGHNAPSGCVNDRCNAPWPAMVHFGHHEQQRRAASQHLFGRWMPDSWCACKSQRLADRVRYLLLRRIAVMLTAEVYQCVIHRVQKLRSKLSWEGKNAKS